MSIGNLVFIDSGGEHYDANTLSQKWNQGGAISEATSGRFNSGGLKVNNPSAPSLTLDFNASTIYIGRAFKTSKISDSPGILTFYDNGTPQVDIRSEADGRISVWRGIAGGGFSTKLGETIAFSLHVDIYYYIEAKVICSNTAGAVELRVNSVTQLNITGVDTASSTNEYITRIDFGGVSSGTFSYIDDVVIHKTKFVGDVRIGVIKPNGVGTNNAWTSTGATLWQVLDEVPPNGDTDYVYTNILNDKFSTQMEDVDLLGNTCEGIQVLVSARKDDSNVRKIKSLILEGGTETLGDETSISTDYWYVRDTYEVNPRTGVKFLDAELDAIEAGAKLTV